MNNRELYENLFEEVKGELNFKQVQELKTLKKENESLIEKKIKKLQKNNRFVKIMIAIILLLILIISVFLQLDILPKFHRFFGNLLIYLPLVLGISIFGKSSLANVQRKMDVFELILILTKNVIPAKASDKK